MAALEVREALGAGDLAILEAQAGQPEAVKAAFEAAMGFVSEAPVNADRREFEKAAFGR